MSRTHTQQGLSYNEEGYVFLDSWEVDAEGDAEGDVSSRPLGHFDKSATYDEVPTDLEAEFWRLKADWLDSVEFGRACLAEVDRAYWSAKGAP